MGGSTTTSRDNSTVTMSSSAHSPSSWLKVQWISRDQPCHAHSPTEPPSKSIASLTKELDDLKHKFMPAAASCADAINDYYERNGSDEKTTASFEFRRARSICNLYESLGAASCHRYSSRKKRYIRQNDNSISSGVDQFVNRSALKLANIDALMGFGLVHPVSSHSHRNVCRGSTRDDDVQDKYFAFVDLCGAPGGFSEYILYRRQHPVKSVRDYTVKLAKEDSNGCGSKKDSSFRHVDTKNKVVDIDNNHFQNIHSSANEVNQLPCYGFGMSLIGSNEDGKGASWDLSHLERYHNRYHKCKKKRKVKCANEKKSSPNKFCHDFLHYKVCNGSDGTGNIYNWENIMYFRREVISTLQKTNLHNEKITGLVHLVVADGGFDAQRDSSSQEEVAHRIIVSQTVTALSLLRPGGNLVIKMFGFQLKRTRAIVQYLYGHFEKIGLIKPIVSRPASAERYLVCLGFDGSDDSWDGLFWRDHMMNADVPPNKIIHSVMDTCDRWSGLNDVLHLFDIQMLQLNIDSCHSIVQYLLEKKVDVAKGELPITDKYSEGKNIDMKFYEQSWYLAC